MKDKTLPKMRREWLIKTVQKLKLEKPIVEIGAKMNKSLGMISTALNPESNRYPTEDFLQSFCKAYRLDWEKARKEIEAERDKIVEAAGPSQFNEPKASYGKISPTLKERDGFREITEEHLIEQLRLQAMKNEMTLYDEFTLKIIGNTLSNAFLNEKLGSLGENVSEKVKWCRVWAQEYYIQRMRGDQANA